MALDASLVSIYTGASDADYWAGLVLSHRLAGTRYLCNANEYKQGEVDGTVRRFAPVPFAFVLPSRDAEGRQELRLHICALGNEVRKLLDAAIEAPGEPVTVRFGEWIEGSTAQRWTPLLELAGTDWSMTRDGVTCTATRADMLNQTVPRPLYTPTSNPGLDRR